MIHDLAVADFIEYSRKRSFGPKQTIIQANEVVQGLYCVIEGSANMLMHDGRREICVASIAAGDFFGEESLLPQPGRACSTVRSRTSLLVAQMDVPTLKRFAHQHPAVLLSIASHFASRLCDVRWRVCNLAFLNVTRRVEYELRALCQASDATRVADGFALRISRQDLGRLVGCSRESAGRALMELEQEGRIRCGSRGRSILVYHLPSIGPGTKDETPSYLVDPSPPASAYDVPQALLAS